MKMNLLRIFLFLKLIIYVKGILEILSKNADQIMEEHLMFLTNYILENYFSHYKCVAFIIDKTNKLNPSYILENIQTNVPIVTIEASEEPLGTNWTAMVERYQLERESNEPWTAPDLLIQALDNQCRGIIIQTDRVQEYMEIIPHLYKVANYKSDRKYMFLPRTANSQPPVLNQIFQLQECGFVRDVLFVLPVNGSCYQMTTHLFDSIQLDALQILGNYCPEDKEIWQPPNLYKKLFPNKMKDLRGRPLRFSSFTYPPYHIIDFENKTYDGLEIRIIKEIARRHNGTIMGLPVLDGQLWGDIYLETMNATGLLGRLWRFEVEFSVGSFYTYEFTNRYLDQSVYYLRGAMHCVAPKPDVVFDWLGPMLPFTSEMWIALGVTLIVVPIALSVITRATIRLVGKRSNQSFKQVVMEGS